MVRVLSVVILLVAACAPDKSNNNQKANSPCVHIGDSCQFAAGKLGVCVAPQGCTGSSCLICQSQH
jgi:hypothetical protein